MIWEINDKQLVLWEKINKIDKTLVRWTKERERRYTLSRMKYPKHKKIKNKRGYHYRSHRYKN